MTKLLVTATHKVGTNRGRRRIWLDGSRLTQAGFVAGISFWSLAVPGKMTLTLREGRNMRRRKVSGRPDGKPIIDITGHDVDVAFPICAAVDVAFHPGSISITPSTLNATKEA
jgi:hypothetical protein